MANGRGSSELGNSVFRCGVRTGLKREFVFALKAQAQLPLSLGRTRSRKSSAATVGAPLVNQSKRRKKSGTDMTPEAAEPQLVNVPLMILSPSPSDLVDAGSPDVVDGKDEAMVAVVPLDNGSSVETLMVMDGRNKSVLDGPPTLKPLKVFVTSLSGGIAEGTVNSHPLLVEPAELRGKANDTANSPAHLDEFAESEIAGQIVVDDNGMSKLNENGCVEYPVVIDGNDGLEVDSSETENQENKTIVSATDYASGEPPIMMPLSIMKMDETGSPVEMSAVIHCLNGRTMESVSSNKTCNRRFTRSTLTLPAKEQKGSSVDHPVTMNGHYSTKNSNSHLGMPLRRLTRSSVKAKLESSSGDITSTSSYSSGSEDINHGADTVDSSSVLIPKSKMELKMSKKITLTKLPNNVRELLSTGLLEGLPVNYIASNSNLQHIGLQGVIKGNGILCSCASCNGSIVVSAYVFEQHAGSTKKHPADFIYLPNGKSLHDVVKACSIAPLDMLEATIQSAIDPVPANKTVTCQKCKGSLLTPWSGKFGLCDLCLRSQQPPETPSLMHGNFSSTSFRVLKTGSVADPTTSSSKNLSSNKKNSLGRLTRKDLGLHKLVFMNDILPEGTEVGYYVCGKRLLEGYIKDSGIYCQCCNSVVSPSQFEAHAGQASRRKPYNYIYTSNGVSLHELSVSLSKCRKMSTSESDDLCSICADGGDLLLCDLCPRAFHKECLGLSSIPSGDWCCQYCQNLHQREKCLSSNDNAIAAGRVAGVDPIEQIYKRCIRIVTTSETDDSACTLCRCHDFSKSRFDDRTVMICDQCEREYHVGCLRDHKMADLKELPAGEWFCCTDCSRIRRELLVFLHHGADSLPFSDANVIKKKRDSRGLNEESLFSRSHLTLLLSLQLEETSFLQWRTVKGQDFGGMYCSVLTVGSCVVSAGILRVLGSDIAELPLVATSREHQGQGYFQSLFACIERLLGSLGVKHLVLPAADEAESIWTKKFGFTKISSDQLEKYLKGAHATVFHGTSMLHKPVSCAEVS
ncbi:hypothetical protein OPV22_018809 [Ensete ventricosum]|uniref:PHD-type domain-containing protein n=1 Tax=Ensete ventricosum TaxID=4639 RepID=A0AAV8QRA3_ENSVE|nr:hypothetical protein OPV22_018809 [Ensete ventricosum]